MVPKPTVPTPSVRPTGTYIRDAQSCHVVLPSWRASTCSPHIGKPDAFLKIVRRRRAHSGWVPGPGSRPPTVTLGHALRWRRSVHESVHTTPRDGRRSQAGGKSREGSRVTETSATSVLLAHEKGFRCPALQGSNPRSRNHQTLGPGHRTAGSNHTLRYQRGRSVRPVSS